MPEGIHQSQTKVLEDDFPTARQMTALTLR